MFVEESGDVTYADIRAKWTEENWTNDGGTSSRTWLLVSADVQVFPGVHVPGGASVTWEWVDGDGMFCRMTPFFDSPFTRGCPLGPPPPPPARPWGRLLECEAPVVGQREADAVACFAERESPRALSDALGYAAWGHDRAWSLLS